MTPRTASIRRAARPARVVRAAGLVLALGAIAVALALAGVWEPGTPASTPEALEMPWARADDPSRDAWPSTRAIEEALELRPGMVVADVGAGAGYFSFRFARAVGRDGRVIATDVDPGMIALIERERARRGTTQLEARQVRGDTPELSPRSVDRIVLVDSLPFTGPHVAGYLRELHRALRGGGRLVVFRHEIHTTEWTPPYGRAPAEDEPSGAQLAGLAAPWFHVRRLEEWPLGTVEAGARPGFLLVLEPR